MPAEPAVIQSDVPGELPVNRGLQAAIWSVVILTVAGICVAFAFQQWSRMRAADSVPLPRFHTVPAFQFTERSGKTFDSAALKGKIWIADFFFTTCPGPCLTMNHRMAEIQGALAKADIDARLVSFTIFPRQDTPEVLRDYAGRFQANPARWYFLTGDKTKTFELATGAFMLGVTDSTTGEEKLAAGEFVHSTKMALVDRGGVVRGYYDSSQPESVKRVMTDIGKLLREQPPGS